MRNLLMRVEIPETGKRMFIAVDQPKTQSVVRVTYLPQDEQAVKRFVEGSYITLRSKYQELFPTGCIKTFSMYFTIEAKQRSMSQQWIDEKQTCVSEEEKDLLDAASAFGSLSVASPIIVFDIEAIKERQQFAAAEFYDPVLLPAAESIRDGFSLSTIGTKSTVDSGRFIFGATDREERNSGTTDDMSDISDEDQPNPDNPKKRAASTNRPKNISNDAMEVSQQDTTQSEVMEASQQDNTNNEAMDVSQEDLQPEQQQNHPSTGATDPGTNPAAGIDQPASGVGTPNSITTGITAQYCQSGTQKV